MTKDAAPSVDEVRAELRKVLESEAFSRAERSQKFLEYVCELTLNGESSRINQYLIGFEVFGRGQDYSTQEDSLVRRQAHVLRQRLDTYYAAEGRSDPVRIMLPLGHYVPQFERHVVAPRRRARRRRGKKPLLPFLMKIVAVLLVALLFGVAGWIDWAIYGWTPPGPRPQRA